jgi:diguanylate cyclase (GGDEF)-like protein
VVCVLIVDDSPVTRQQLHTLLEAKGYKGVLTAPDGHSALRVLGEGTAAAVPPVDVVLMDVDMPGLDGIETCRIIKATPHLNALSVLMVTGNAEERILEQAFSAGACDYLTKPIGTIELLARLRSALALKRELDASRARARELLQVTERLQRLNEELRRLSIMDGLTGVANRRFFNFLLAQEWRRAARSGLPVALVMIDVDCFKNYNDHYGHLQGDNCLVRVAHTLQTFVRRSGDLVARYGGEEFSVLLPATEAQGAAAVAELLRSKIEELDLEHAHSAADNRVTISLGVAAIVPGRDSAPEVLVAAADKALYQAKHEGRNCVRVCNSPLAHLPVPSQSPDHAQDGFRFRRTSLEPSSPAALEQGLATES